jgi:hypothetical protein
MVQRLFRLVALAGLPLFAGLALAFVVSHAQPWAAHAGAPAPTPAAVKTTDAPYGKIRTATFAAVPR